MKPTVLEQRNPLDLHTLMLAHSGLLTRRHAALGAGQANISQIRSSSFRTEVKDVLARTGRSAFWTVVSYEDMRPGFTLHGFSEESEKFCTLTPEGF
jgi:hypothetical protein